MAEDRRDSKPQPQPDPFELWREWVTQSEHQMNKVLNDMMGTEQFARASGGWVEAMTMFQQTMNENAERYLQMTGVPSRSDVGELAERLTAVEERLQRIEALLAAAVGRRDAPSPAPRPARTRRPPSERRRATEKDEKGPDGSTDGRLVDAVPSAAPAADDPETS